MHVCNQFRPSSVCPRIGPVKKTLCSSLNLVHYFLLLCVCCFVRGNRLAFSSFCPLLPSWPSPPMPTQLFIAVPLELLFWTSVRKRKILLLEYGNKSGTNKNVCDKAELFPCSCSKHQIAAGCPIPLHSELWFYIVELLNCCRNSHRNCQCW